MEVYFRESPEACRRCILELVGKRLTMASHAGSMRGFHFGELGPIHGKAVGQIVLHIQCPWRLLSGGRILTGLGDWGQFAHEGQRDLVGWEPSKHGNRQHRVLEEWMGSMEGAVAPIVSHRTDLTVSSANIDEYGSAELIIAGGDSLQIFPDMSLEENWRIFYPSGAHFVI